MTPADLDELERLARAATPGKWRANVVSDSVAKAVGVDRIPPHVASVDALPDGRRSTRLVAVECWNDADARYIAAANPETTLALIARVRELKRLVRRRHRGWR